MNIQPKSPTCAPYIEIAIDVLKKRSSTSIQWLKDFLTALPSPTDVEYVLKTAICNLASHDPDTCLWVLHHAEYLQPELYVIELARQIALETLQRQGFLINQDFNFDSSNTLEMGSRTTAILLDRVSESDRRLIQEILQIVQSNSIHIL